jgi:hypothetical protein
MYPYVILETVKHDLSCSADLLVHKEFLQASTKKSIGKSHCQKKKQKY